MTQKLINAMNKVWMIFCNEEGIPSSKRIVAFLGMAIIFGCYIHAEITNTEMPSNTEFLASCCVTLLGIEPVTSIFKK